MTDGTDSLLRSKGVFISYRRGETSGQARALHDRLAQRFGADRVFMDVDSIAPGADFVQKIEEAIGSSGVALVLIGRDWLSRESDEHLLDDPMDFIRLEADTALRSGVPVIPILVERARMPAPEELPESLRPLTRRNALELENQRWEYDVGRLVRAVEQLVDPTPVVSRPEPDTVGIRPEVIDKPTKQGDRPRRSRRLVLAGLGVLVAVIALVVVLLLRPGPVRTSLPSVSAGHAVQKVSSDRMAGLLLESRLSSKEIPSDVSASNPELVSFRTFGLVDAVYVPLFGPASVLSLNYFVFDNLGDASSYYANGRPLPDGYTLIGHFVPAGIGDSRKCDTGLEEATSTQATRWESSCETLSAKVVSFIVVTSLTNSTAADKSLSATLTRDAIRHLSRVADAASPAPVTSPPALLTPRNLSAQIYSSPLLGDLLPTGITLVSLQKFTLGSSSPGGLVAGTYIRATLAGKSYRDSVYFYVFDSARHAQAFYRTRLRPTGYTSTGSIDSSGFSQQASCGTYLESASSGSAATHISGCAVLWGDVVAYSEAGPSSNVPQDADDLAVTLARMAVIELNRLDSN